MRDHVRLQQTVALDDRPGLMVRRAESGEEFLPLRDQLVQRCRAPG
jgi:hypothetical protein